MKKIALAVGTIAALVLLGAGCAPASEPSAETNNNAVSSTNQSKAEANANSAIGAPEALPEITPPAVAIDDSAWTATTTKSGITLKTPTKGATAPTSWTYSLLDSNNPNLKGDCYTTDATVYQKATGFSYANACQTTTELNVGPGERTDYFVFRTAYTNSKGKSIEQINMFTFTKKYPAGFDMNAYGATLERIISDIKG